MRVQAAPELLKQPPTGDEKVEEVSTGSSGVLRSGLGEAINSLSDEATRRRAREIARWTSEDTDASSAHSSSSRAGASSLPVTGGTGRALREDELDEDADGFLTWICRYPVEVSTSRWGQPDKQRPAALIGARS